MSKVMVEAAGGYIVADILSTHKTQSRIEKKQRNIATAQTNLANAEIEYNNAVIEQIDILKQHEKEARKQVTDTVFEKFLNNEININEIKDPELRRMIQEYLDGNRTVSETVEIKEKLQKYVSQMSEFDQKKTAINTELLMMQQIVSRVAHGEKVDARFDNGKIIIILPEDIVKRGIEEFSKKQMERQGFTAYGGRHRREMLEFISEYAELKISRETKLTDVELILQGEILRNVMNKMMSDSYRSGETDDRNSRYRDPRKASSLLDQNNITEKTIEQDVRKSYDIKDIGRVDEHDVRKLAEQIYENVKDKDSLSGEQQKELMDAIEGKIEEKVTELKMQKKIADLTENEYVRDNSRDIEINISEEKQKELEQAIDGAIKDNTEDAGRILRDKLGVILSSDEMDKIMVDSKDLVKLIAGKTEVEVPSHLLDLAENAQRLRDARTALHELEPNTKYRETDVDGLITQIGRKK